MKKYIFTVLAFLSILASTNYVRAESFPEFPMSFYGQAILDGNQMPAGFIIRAYYGNNLGGQAVVDSYGKYGYTELNKQRLVVKKGEGLIVFKFVDLSGSEKEGLSVISHPSFSAGTAVEKIISFTTVTQVASQSSGGGGGGGSPSPVTQTQAQTPTVIISTPQAQLEPVVIENKPKSQVLGATSFRFNTDLEFGMESDTVVELQKNLTSAGVYSGPITGYFGPLTRAAVKKYQEKSGIKSTGYFGPLTREKMNGSKVAGVSISREQQIVSLKIQIAELMKLVEELLKAKAAQAR